MAEILWTLGKIVFMVIVVDLLYGWIDPRVRLE